MKKDRSPPAFGQFDPLVNMQYRRPEAEVMAGRIRHHAASLAPETPFDDVWNARLPRALELLGISWIPTTTNDVLRAYDTGIALVDLVCGTSMSLAMYKYKHIAVRRTIDEEASRVMRQLTTDRAARRAIDAAFVERKRVERRAAMAEIEAECPTNGIYPVEHAARVSQKMAATRLARTGAPAPVAATPSSSANTRYKTAATRANKNKRRARP
jgi:hypothetical protein